MKVSIETHKAIKLQAAMAEKTMMDYVRDLVEKDRHDK